MVELSFNVEWFDSVTSITSQMYLRFYSENNTLEILTDKRTFLGRIYYGKVTMNDLFIGNTVTIYNRLYTITGFANAGTEQYFKKRQFHSLVVVDKESLDTVDRLFELSAKLNISFVQMNTVDSNGSVLGTKLLKGDYIVRFFGVDLGPNEDKFIEGCKKLNFHIAKIDEDDLDLLKSLTSGAPTIPQNCSLCLLKPEIVRKNQVGAIINDILSAGQFGINAITTLHMNVQMAEELFEDYRNVFTGYGQVIEHLCSGAMVAIQIVGESDNIVEDFREFTGPFNPAIAKQLRPKSLRAKYGQDVVENAVHCTDLDTDGAMECDYIFSTLASL